VPWPCAKRCSGRGEKSTEEADGNVCAQSWVGGSGGSGQSLPEGEWGCPPPPSSSPAVVVCGIGPSSVSSCSEFPWFPSGLSPVTECEEPSKGWGREQNPRPPRPPSARHGLGARGEPKNPWKGFMCIFTFFVFFFFPPLFFSKLLRWFLNAASPEKQQRSYLSSK